jgi:hypothetical protein
MSKNDYLSHYINVQDRGRSEPYRPSFLSCLCPNGKLMTGAGDGRREREYVLRVQTSRKALFLRRSRTIAKSVRPGRMIIHIAIHYLSGGRCF